MLVAKSQQVRRVADLRLPYQAHILRMSLCSLRRVQVEAKEGSKRHHHHQLEWGVCVCGTSPSAKRTELLPYDMLASLPA